MTDSPLAISEKEEYAYNSNGDRILHESLQYDLYQPGVVGWGYKEVNVYDADYNESSHEYYLWNNDSNNWKGSTRSTYDERDAAGNLIISSEYIWNNNQWEKSEYTIYYPDPDQAEPVVLKPTTYEVAASTIYSYPFDLESLLPGLPGLGNVTYAIGTVTDADGIIGTDNPAIEGATLTIPIKDVEVGKSATIEVIITTTNNGLFQATIEVKTISKKRVNISATMEGGIYSNEAFEYTGTPEITELSDTEDPVNDLELDIRYEIGGVLSETAPVNAGDYKLILSVPADNPDYIGSLSINFTIERRPIQIVAENKTVQVGSADLTFTYSVGGVIGDETAITGAPILSSSANLSVAGTYAIEVSLAGVAPTANYTFDSPAFVNGTLTVTGGDDTPDVPDTPTPTTPVSGVSLNTAGIELAVSGTFQLAATVSPSGATNQGVSWSTSNAAIATVANGQVTAIAPGTATITVTTNDGGYTATCTVVVTDGSVGTEKVSQEVTVFFNESALTVDSPANETVAVYDFNGRLLFADKKPVGKAVFTVANSAGSKAVIVKGSSGWTKKLVR